MTTKHIRPGGRFFHELQAQYVSITRRGGGPVRAPKRLMTNVPIDWRTAVVRHIFDDPETRRLVIDARQAAMFADLEEMPPIVDRLHTPFDQMYVEFTEPIVLAEPEPGFDEELLAFTVNRAERNDEKISAEPMYAVLLFFRSTTAEGRVYYTDRGFALSAKTGVGFSAFENYSEQFAPDVSTFPEEIMALARRDKVADEGHLYVEARAEGEGRGLWERLVAAYAAFVSWSLSYMTARGVIIVEVAESRQVIRAAKRRGERPRPWHVVTVKPTRYAEDADDEGGSGRSHGYRYDVRGHLRVGRHKRGDGTYRERIEWVRPHQRGLKHTLYIPKTYAYDGGRGTP
jgi:hypothetical protein